MKNDVIGSIFDSSASSPDKNEIIFQPFKRLNH